MRAIAATCLALGLLVTGCNGTGEPASGPSPSAKASPRPSAATTSEVSATHAASPSPVPDPPPATGGRKASVAFAKYVLQGWIYALNTNDPSPLLDVSGPKPCEGCAGLAKELAKRKKEGWYVVLEGVRASTARSRTDGRRSTVTLSVDVPASSTYNTDGSFRSTNPAHPHASFAVEMTRTGNDFRLDSFSLY